MFVDKILSTLAIITARTGRPEPVMKRAQVVAAIGSIATLAAMFGIQVSTGAQAWGVRGVMIAVAVSPIASAFLGRKHVTANADPQDAYGNPLEPVPADHVIVHKDVADRGIAAAVNDAVGTTADVAIDQTSALGHVVGGIGDIAHDLFGGRDDH